MYDTLVVMTPTSDLPAPDPHVLELADQRIAYAERAPVARGDAGDNPLVLLHGGGVDHRMWAPQWASLPGRRLIAPDARGHGRSSEPTPGYRLCDDVVALLDGLGMERAVLVGLSMGGGTAVDTALEHPDRVAGLVVSGAGTSEPQFSDPWVLDIQQEWARTMAAQDAEGWIAATLRFTEGSQRAPEEVAPGVRAAVEEMVRHTLAEHLPLDETGAPLPPTPPTPVTRTWERLPDIAVPVLGLVGLLDSTDHLAMVRTLARTVPTGEVVEIPEAAHYPTMERPDAVEAAIEDFLLRHAL